MLLDMADDAMKVTIQPALAERIRHAAKAAGQSVDDFVNGLLDFEQIGPTDWDEIDRICDGASETGIPWEEFEPRPRNLGKAPPS